MAIRFTQTPSFKAQVPFLFQGTEEVLECELKLLSYKQYLDLNKTTFNKDNPDGDYWAQVLTKEVLLKINNEFEDGQGGLLSPETAAMQIVEDKHPISLLIKPAITAYYQKMVEAQNSFDLVKSKRKS
jgi:hypothetical protein